MQIVPANSLTGADAGKPSPAQVARLHEAVRRHLRISHLRISSDDLTRLCPPFQAGELRKKTYLLQPRQVCNFEVFVAKGCLSLYALDARGHKHVLYFASEGWWLSDIDSFTSQLPSRLYVEALEDAEFLFIRKAAKEPLYEALPAVERLFRLMTQKTHVVLQRRLLASFSESAAER